MMPPFGQVGLKALNVSLAMSGYLRFLEFYTLRKSFLARSDRLKRIAITLTLYLQSLRLVALGLDYSPLLLPKLGKVWSYLAD
jgi:hypothetical protein